MIQELIQNREIVLNRLEDKAARLKDYAELQKALHATNVSLDHPFQQTFRRYYTMGRARNGAAWFHTFFSLLEREKTNPNINLSSVLTEFAEATRQIDLSFCSKLVATIRPADMPVWDRNVRLRLGMGMVWGHNHEQRLHCAIRRYADLTQRMNQEMAHPRFPELLDCFDQRFRMFQHFTPLKKLDLLLWQYPPA